MTETRQMTPDDMIQIVSNMIPAQIALLRAADKTMIATDEMLAEAAVGGLVQLLIGISQPMYPGAVSPMHVLAGCLLQGSQANGLTFEDATHRFALAMADMALKFNMDKSARAVARADPRLG